MMVLLLLLACRPTGGPMESDAPVGTEPSSATGDTSDASDTVEPMPTADTGEPRPHFWFSDSTWHLELVDGQPDVTALGQQRVFVDVDGDGRFEVAMAGLSDTYVFELPDAPGPIASDAHILRFPGEGMSDLQVHDFDGDGLDDLLLYATAGFGDDSIVIRFAPDLENRVLRLVNPERGRGVWRVAVGDFDGDGASDVAHQADGVVSVYYGPLEPGPDQDPGSTFGGIVGESTDILTQQGDLDADGVQDLVALAGGRSYLCRGPLAQDVDGELLTVLRLVPEINESLPLLVRNLDGQGTDGVFLDRYAEPRGAHLFPLPLDIDEGSVAIVTPDPLGPDVIPDVMSAEDINGDGIGDAFVSIRHREDALLVLGPFTSAFDVWTDWAAYMYVEEKELRAIDWADLDGDGVQDMMYGPASHVRIRLMGDVFPPAGR